jgi:hypothetical protein
LKELELTISASKYQKTTKKMVIKAMRGYAYDGQSLESGLEGAMPVKGKALNQG